MDTSPVQSTSKCNSDFSIERILSSDNTTHTRKQSDEVPNWLCCTRYRPPRVPRAVNGGGCRSRRSGSHARVPFTAAQAAALEAAYARAQYLAPPALRALAAALQLRDDRIKIWFQNRRARERREKSVNITPPLSVTIPPTTVRVPSWITSTCPWSPINSDATNHTLNYHTMKPEEPGCSERRVLYEGDDVSFSERSSCESADDNKSELHLDIETIED